MRRFNTIEVIDRKIDLGKVAVSMARMGDDAYYPKNGKEAGMVRDLKVPYIELLGQHDRINFDTVAMIEEYYEKLQTARGIVALI